MSATHPSSRGAPRRRLARLGIVFAIAVVFTPTLSAQESVTVYRDAIGLAHVYADTDEAVAYGLGRMHVRERPLLTLYNLTRAAGALTRTMGQFDPKATRESDRHYRDDRRAVRYHREARARWLHAHYLRTGAPAEDQAMVAILTAFVAGVNDERVALLPILTAYYRSHRYDLAWVLRLTADQYDALFRRKVEVWEPLALYHLVMRSLWEGIVDEHGPPSNVAAMRLLPAGSNSFCVPSGGSASGHTFVHSDSHQATASYVSVRFKARRGKLDGGGFAVSGTPFLLIGFGANVSWALTLGGDFSADTYTYDGDATSTPGSYVDDTGKTVPLRIRKHALPFRLTPQSPLTTLSVTDRYLDADEDMPVTATAPGREGHVHTLYASRFSYGNPEPPTANDPGCDTLRALYRLVTARDADDALHHAIGGTLSIVGVRITIGDEIRGITLPAYRVPYRRNETPFRAGWRSEHQVEHMSGRNHGWTQVNGRTLHPVTDLPTVRSDGVTPVRSGRPVRFWANCNSTPIWLLGLGQPFGLPGSMLPHDIEHPDYINPFDPVAYVRLPTSLTGMHHFGPPFGLHTVRQEWMTMGLKAAWEAGRNTKPAGIDESVLLTMIRDHHSPLPYFLSLRGFFSDLIKALPAGASRDLATRLNSWSRRLAPHPATASADGADAARFQVFWVFFRREMPGPWTRSWKLPFESDFIAPREDQDVMTGAQKALALTVAVFARYPNLDLGTLKRFAVPFGGPNLPVPGSNDSGFVSQNAWVNPPWSTGPPLINGGGGGRMPMLLRMRKSGESHHRVRMMMPTQAGRVNTLPEWTAIKGPDFHAAPRRWARAELYDLPMTEAALKALGYDSKVTLAYTHKP